jgi:hypothetical protein
VLRVRIEVQWFVDQAPTPVEREAEVDVPRDLMVLIAVKNEGDRTARSVVLNVLSPAFARLEAVDPAEPELHVRNSVAAVPSLAGEEGLVEPVNAAKAERDMHPDMIYVYVLRLTAFTNSREAFPIVARAYGDDRTDNDMSRVWLKPNAVQLAAFDDRCGWFLGLGPVGVSGTFDMPLGHLAFDQARA